MAGYPDVKGRKEPTRKPDTYDNRVVTCVGRETESRHDMKGDVCSRCSCMLASKLEVETMEKGREKAIWMQGG